MAGKMGWGLEGGGSPEAIGDGLPPQREVQHRCSSSSVQRRRGFWVEKLRGAALKAGASLVEVGEAGNQALVVGGGGGSRWAAVCSRLIPGVSLHNKGPA